MERVRFKAQVIPETPEISTDIQSKLNTLSKISLEEKQQIFSPFMEVMQRMLQEHGIPLPQNLLSRLFVVNQKTFTAFQDLFRDKDSPHPPVTTHLGTALPNRLALINWDAVIRREKRDLKREDILRGCGIHELWHSLEYREVWVRHHLGLWDPNRRVGIFTRRPGRTFDVFQGLSALGEGFIEYLTRTVLRSYKTLRIYQDEVEMVGMLIEKIGIDPFYQATFTKKGFRKMFGAIEEQYGKHSLPRLIGVINDDLNLYSSRSPLRRAVTPIYEQTMQFIKST